MRVENSSSNATLWTLGGFGASQLLRLLGNLILARLLIPDDFGLMALIAILMQGLVMFSDIGIGPSIIRSPRGDDLKFLNTAWTVQVLRGAALWLCAGLLCIPFAHFYEVAALMYLIPAASAAVFLAGFNSTGIFTENRRLHLGRISMLEIGSQLGGLIVMVGWALVAPSVWALVVGGLITALLKAVFSHVLLPGSQNRLSWDAAALRELFGFGQWIFLSTAFAFLSLQLDRMILGKLVPLDILGIYTIGFLWARAPLQLCLTWSSKVFYPIAVNALSSEDPVKRDGLKQYRNNVLVIAAPLIACLIVSMPMLIDALYLPSYQMAGYIGSIFAAGTWLGILAATYGSVNMASGKPHFISIAAASQIVLFLLLVVPAYSHWGAYGVAAAVCAARVASYSVSVFGAFKAQTSSMLNDLKYTALMIGFSYFLYQISLSLEGQYYFKLTELFIICLISGITSLILFYRSAIRSGRG